MAAAHRERETSTRRPSRPAKTCDAKNKRGGICKHGAGWGTDHPGFGHCKMHLGNTPTGRAYAANEEAVQLGQLVELEPHDALLDALYRQAAVVAFYAQRVSGLDQDKLLVEHRRERVTDSDDGSGTFVETSTDAGVHVWVQKYEQAVVQQAKLAKAAIDAGVAERHVRVIEAHAEMFARALDGILGDLDLTADQLRRAEPIVRKHLTVLEGGRQAA